uniref:Uncharacterized protein n=1 Tax=Arundo donax TaxID=35708 RepID=A0A0A9FS24_ARUDO
MHPHSSDKFAFRNKVHLTIARRLF